MKIRVYISLLVVISKIVIGSSQTNLIPNPDFEEYDQCPTMGAQFTGFVKDWTARTNIPEYFNDCGYLNFGLKAISGKGYSGCNEYYQLRNTCEYIQTMLINPLKKSKTYYLSYYARRGSPFTTVYLGQGIWFTSSVSYKSLDSIYVTPQFFDTTTLVTDQAWSKIFGCFKADSNYSVMVVGNFIRPEKIRWLGNPEVSVYSLYDNFELYEIPDSLELILDKDSICAGECIQIKTNMSLIDGEFKWKFGGGGITNSNDSIVELCYEQAGDFNIELELTNCAGAYSKKWLKAVHVSERPIITGPLYQKFILETGTPLQLLPGGNGSTYHWIPEKDVDCFTCETTQTNQNTNNQLFYCIINESSPCALICTTEVIRYRKPISDFAVDKNSICEGDCINITNKSQYIKGSYVYLLQGPEKYQGESTTGIKLCPEKSGTYAFVAVVKNEYATDTFYAPLFVKVNAYPERLPEIRRNYEVLSGESQEIESCLKGDHYMWTSKNINCDNCPNPKWQGKTSEKFSVIAYNESPQCSDSCNYEIELIYNKSKVYIPNSFTPNQDGLNDKLEVYGENILGKKFEVYDRWGELIYHSNDNFYWDGEYKGQHMNPGVYVVRYEYLDLHKNKLENIIQDVSLIR